MLPVATLGLLLLGQCRNTCETASNGVCDDGGTGKPFGEPGDDAAGGGPPAKVAKDKKKASGKGIFGGLFDKT